MTHSIKQPGCAYGAPGELVRLAVIVLVILRFSITVHSHDIREHSARPVVLVRIEEDTEALEFVDRAEDVTGGRALLGEPHSEAVAEKVALAMNLELDQDLIA